MKTVKTTNKHYKTIATQLLEARKLQSQAKKMEKTAKEFIINDLAKRGIEVKALPIGETVLVKLNDGDGEKDCIRLTVKSKSDIDVTKLSLQFPEVEKKCRIDRPCVFFDPLVGTNLEEVASELEKRKEQIEKTLKVIRGSVPSPINES